VSHIHPDHFDQAAAGKLPRDIPVFCQPGDERLLKKQGLSNVSPVAGSISWEGISIFRVEGRHGEGKMQEMMGEVSGFVLQSETDPTVYWVGDSIFCPEVEQNLEQFRPEVVVTHSGGAAFPGQKPIIMDGEQTLKVLQTAPWATVVAIHMQALDHCWLSREGLRDMAQEEGIPASRLFIPQDGETISL
ncbi:MAG: MBL fold metallo-hydrolase, partial [Desulfohalobiaceae bacterium]